MIAASSFLLVLAVAVVGIVLLGKAPDLAQGAVGLLPTRGRVRDALRAAALDYGLNPDWLDALGWVESQWRLDAVNNTGGDAARGGAWGPTQITATTARAYGYTDPMENLTTDPELAAKWTAIIMAAGNPQTIEDAAAWWNAGKKSIAKAPAVTRDEYLPRLVAALDKVTSEEASA